MKEEELFYLLLLSNTPSIGPVSAVKLLKAFGSAHAVYQATDRELLQDVGLFQNQVNQLRNNEYSKNAQQEIDFITSEGIDVYSILDKEYPQTLKQIPDAPVVLFGKGKKEPLHNRKNISIVGTRKMTPYGKKSIDEIIEYLSDFDVSIISGFALGVDITAHLASMQHQIPTYGILAHGFHRIYPSQHKKYIDEMLENGGFLTEYTTSHEPLREHFLQRNRLIAGMSDVTIVIESSYGGGAMTTANYAFHYNKEVFAVPGKIYDMASQGCNTLIKDLKAQILTRPEDLGETLGVHKKPKKNPQKKLLLDLSPEQQRIYDLIAEEKTHIDELSIRLGMPIFKLNSMLFSMQMENIVECLPGNFYQITD